MPKIIPILKAETMIPFGDRCHGVTDLTAAAEPRRCPFWQVTHIGCRYLGRNDAALARQEKVCAVRRQNPDDLPLSPTAFSRCFVSLPAR